MTETPAHDKLGESDRVYLEKLRLAASVLLDLGEENMIPGPLESELYLFRDRVDRALLGGPEAD